MTYGERWCSRFLDVARLVATWSKDPSTQVGCVLVDQRRRIVATGYNGFPAQIPDLPDAYEDRERKYQLIVHAEINAIANAPTSTRGTVAFLTHPPCSECFKSLLTAGIVEVHFVAPDKHLLSRWQDSINLSAKIANLANVPFVAWDRTGDRYERVETGLYNAQRVN